VQQKIVEFKSIEYVIFARSLFSLAVGLNSNNYNYLYDKLHKGGGKKQINKRINIKIVKKYPEMGI
tara:strand:- start:159 stop:356 length:198 start_codon:yes stop_codon:yes gene_type:complete